MRCTVAIPRAGRRQPARRRGLRDSAAGSRKQYTPISAGGDRTGLIHSMPHEARPCAARRPPPRWRVHYEGEAYGPHIDEPRLCVPCRRRHAGPGSTDRFLGNRRPGHGLDPGSAPWRPCHRRQPRHERAADHRDGRGGEILASEPAGSDLPNQGDAGRLRRSPARTVSAAFWRSRPPYHYDGRRQSVRGGDRSGGSAAAAVAERLGRTGDHGKAARRAAGGRPERSEPGRDVGRRQRQELHPGRIGLRPARPVRHRRRGSRQRHIVRGRRDFPRLAAVQQHGAQPAE